MISELSWSEYSLVEDAFVDPDTPVAKRNIDFHSPLDSQLEKIVHEIRGDLYHEDSGTLSDMDSSSSETTITNDKEQPCTPVSNGGNVTDDFSIEVGGFAIACESDVGNKEDISKGNDYMYEIGTKFIEPFAGLQETSESRNNEIVTSTSPQMMSQETTMRASTITLEDADMELSATKPDSTEEPALLSSSPPQARPRSAPTLRSFQQRKSSRIQLKSFSTTSLVPRQPPAATLQKQVTQYHPHASMSEEFPRWLYSEVVKAGLQICKPSFVRSPSISLNSSDSNSDSVDEESIADSTDDQSMEVSTNQHSTKLSTDQQSTNLSIAQQSSDSTTNQEPMKSSADQPWSTKLSTYQQSAKASNDQKPMEMPIDHHPSPMNGLANGSPFLGKSQSQQNDTKSKEQFDHYGAICYLWRGKQ